MPARASSVRVCAEDLLALGPWQDAQRHSLADACSAALLRGGSGRSSRRRPAQTILSFANYFSTADVATLRDPEVQLTVKLDRRSTVQLCTCSRLLRHCGPPLVFGDRDANREVLASGDEGSERGWLDDF